MLSVIGYQTVHWRLIKAARTIAVRQPARYRDAKARRMSIQHSAQYNYVCEVYVCYITGIKDTYSFSKKYFDVIKTEASIEKSYENKQCA